MALTFIFVGGVFNPRPTTAAAGSSCTFNASGDTTFVAGGAVTAMVKPDATLSNADFSNIANGLPAGDCAFDSSFDGTTFTVVLPDSTSASAHPALLARVRSYLRATGMFVTITTTDR